MHCPWCGYKLTAQTEIVRERTLLATSIKEAKVCRACALDFAAAPAPARERFWKRIQSTVTHRVP